MGGLQRANDQLKKQKILLNTLTFRLIQIISNIITRKEKISSRLSVYYNEIVQFWKIGTKKPEWTRGRRSNW